MKNMSKTLLISLDFERRIPYNCMSKILHIYCKERKEKQMKRIAKFLSAAMAAMAVITAAVPAVKSYAAKEFTYAEQSTKKQVTELSMKPEETTDLCFIGVPDYSEYTCKWVSSNETVATVDNMGVVTAKEQGTAKISLVLGDGTVYTSEPVVVTIVNMTLTAGTSTDKAMTLAELKQGDTLDLNFYGVTDWSSRKNAYMTEWTSSDETVAEVNQADGTVTAVGKGTSVIVFHIYDVERDILLNSTPVTVIVAE